jgi:hypothetical protein
MRNTKKLLSSYVLHLSKRKPRIRKKNKQKYFSEEFIVGVGFLSGTWSSVGISPGAIVFDSLLNVIIIYTTDFKYGFIFHLTPLIVTAFSCYVLIPWVEYLE